MDNHNSNTHVPTTGSQKAAPTPMSERDLVPPALDGRWLDQLTPCEIESLLERRAPLLRSMLLASADAETQSAMYVLEAASSNLDAFTPPSYAVWAERRDFLLDLVDDVFAEAASRIREMERVEAQRAALLASAHESESRPLLADQGSGSQPAPSIEQLQALSVQLMTFHGDRWQVFMQLMTVCGLRLRETIALRFDSFHREADGTWTACIVDALHDVGSGPIRLRKNLTSRRVPLPPPLANRMVELFGERLGASSEFVFAAQGEREPRPGTVLLTLSAAMRRAGWSMNLSKSPTQSLRAAWRAHGNRLAESFWPTVAGEGDGRKTLD